MKKLLQVLAVVFFSTYAGNLFATPTLVTVFSSNYSVNGLVDVSVSPPFGDNIRYYNDYNDSGAASVSGGVSFDGIGIYPSAWARSSAGFFSISVLAHSLGSGNQAEAFATAESTFSPLSTMDSLSIQWADPIHGPFMFMVNWASYNVILEDLTDPTQICNISKSDLWNDFVNSYPNQNTYPGYLIQHSFETDHVYRLYAYSSVGGGGDGTWGGSLWTNDLVPAPEPTTMLLLSLGLMGLAGVRRKLS